MRKIVRSLLIITIAAAPAGAVAQDQPKTPDGPDIIVTAPRPIDDEVRDFVGALTETPGTRQLSRFETRAACPTAVGIPVAQRDAVVRRMRRVAAGAGVPLAKEKCDANILVIVTRDKKVLIETLARRYSYLLGTLTPKQVRELAASPGPAAAWQLAGPQLNADGKAMVADPDSDTYINFTTLGGSRITAGARPQFAAAVVVVESKALVGLTTTQFADYAAMRTYASTDPARLKGVNVSTILKILDAAPDSEVPVTLTSWDMGFLRGLYTSPVNLRADAQRSAIGNTLKKDVKAPAKSDR